MNAWATSFMRKRKVQKADLEKISEFIFEPNQAEILNNFLPRLLEVQLYQAVLESEASEHSSRMFAMRNASDAASEMMSELTLVYNQARQAGITAEIAEISAGAAALS
jgi:F-type H+-transporting ATPase subunit gamma